MAMTAKLIRLTDGQMYSLQTEADRLGIPVTELIRRILDEHFQKRGDVRERAG